MPLSWESLCGAGIDGLVGGADGLFDSLFERNALITAAEGRSTSPTASGACNLAGRGATHAVADNIDSVLGGDAEGIFVGRAHAAAIGNRRNRVANFGGGQGNLSRSPVYTGQQRPERGWHNLAKL